MQGQDLTSSEAGPIQATEQATLESTANPLPRLPNLNLRRRRRSPSEDREEIVVLPGIRSSNSTRRTEGISGGELVDQLRLRQEGPSAPKRQRLMNRDMRQDASSAISNGSQRSNNGSSLGSHTNGFSKSANGHSSPSNGSPSSNHMNGLGSASDKERSPTYFGHDREEVTRLLLQGLWDLGYESAAEKLRQESGYEVESPTVSAFRSAIEQGEWRDAELLLFGHSVEPDGGGVSIGNGHSDHQQGLRLSDNADECLMRFHLREQKYLELLENQKTGEALMVLRTELAPLNCNISRLSVLSE